MKVFFVVKDVDGSFELHSLWPSFAKAESVAERLSTKNPETTIHVVEAMTAFKAGRRI